jgi:Transposase IS66 family
LGKAINYMLRHWSGLTVFLRQPGSPLDNNLCEQVLKRAVLHRLCRALHRRCYAEVQTMLSSHLQPRSK